jgi:hypothetical protein
MKSMRFALGAICLLIAAPVTFGACGGDEPSADPKIRYCEQLCACNKCPESELGTCKDDIINLEDDAKNRDCKSEFDSYVNCLVADASCSDGDYDESSCSADQKALNGCLNPVKPCMTVNNGVCNEPAPKGDGTCAAGSDTADCMAPPTCNTTANGACDEPGGTGSGLCAQGSDAVDCACAYTNDGDCDEPEGSGYCFEGYDAADCKTTCFTCSEGLADPQNAGTPCNNSIELFQAYYMCACDTASVCYSLCSSSICAGVAPSTTCAACATCTTQYNQCINDKPAP